MRGLLQRPYLILSIDHARPCSWVAPGLTPISPPPQYEVGDPITLWVNKVGPYNNPQETCELALGAGALEREGRWDAGGCSMLAARSLGCLCV